MVTSDTTPLPVINSAVDSSRGADYASKPIYVNDPNRVRYESEHIISTFTYQDIKVQNDMSSYIITPIEKQFELKTCAKVPKLGLMMVGLGGNNGTTLTAALLAHKKNISWRTRSGIQTPNYYGSLLMSGTISLGSSTTPLNVPFYNILPMVNPIDIVIGGWDISSLNLAQAMERAAVLEPGLQQQLYKDMELIQPLPSIYNQSFIALNQYERADHILPQDWSLQQQLDTIRQNIRDFKHQNQLEKVIVVWTATTERYMDFDSSFESSQQLLQAIKEGKISKDEISPSLLFAIASILESCPFINGSPQNTLSCNAIQQLALQHEVPISGDDFKTGQTKLKSVLVDFLIGAGIKPIAITSYNHLGNNDGRNLSAPLQFRSKEISKSTVIDDMVESNPILYKKGETPDHVVVIKYVPAVGDSKRALDEYENEIFMGGRNTISIHNTCEDSLLAAPVILDLVLLTELLTRVSIKTESSYEPLYPISSLLGYFLKAPLPSPDGTVVNALAKQRLAIENLFRILIGCPLRSELNPIFQCYI